jgi:exosortase
MDQFSPKHKTLWVGLIVALIGLSWSYWSTLNVLAQRWSVDPLYSHGFIVPVVAAILIWLRRDLLAPAQLTGSRGKITTITQDPCWIAGIALVSLGVGMRLVAARYYYEWFDGLSLVPCAAGLCLLIGGRAAWRTAWPAIAFLSFMVPLPYRLEMSLSGPLQSFATSASTFGLQTLGFPAVAEGNLIVIDETYIGVAEACSGLRMLMVFFAVTTAVAIYIKKPVWERLLIISSAVPIALICNVVRITATGVLFETVGSGFAKLVLHDFAGWLMMLLAIVLLKIELWMLSRILIAPPERDVIPVLGQRVSKPTRAKEAPVQEQRLPPEIKETSDKELFVV